MTLLARVAVLLLLVAPSCSVPPPQPGWIADARTGCKVWNAFPEPNESVTWSGACQNGIWQGRGVLQWFHYGTPSDREEGEFRDGRLNGQGVITWPDGDRYEGDFVDGRRTGQGVYTFANGNRKAGQWLDGDFIAGTSVAAIQAPPNTHTHALPYRDEIQLAKAGGVLVAPVRINGAITLNFLIDSGAADVSIPADVVLTLFRTGTLTDADFLGKRTYRLADGSTVPSETFRIRVLKVGDRELENVIGSIADVRSVPLLGQSFLSRFRSWSIDNQRQILVLE
jgi:hypothetical protein